MPLRRMAVANTWVKLTENRAVPLGHWMEVTRRAVWCLDDDSAFVQKVAVGLLKSLLSFNPFGVKLDGERFKASLDEFKDKLEVSDSVFLVLETMVLETWFYGNYRMQMSFHKGNSKHWLVLGPTGWVINATNKQEVCMQYFTVLRSGESHHCSILQV